MSYSKNEILEQITEDDIYTHYVKDYRPEIVGNRNLKSIFNEEEKNPSLSFYKKNNRVLYKCHSTGYQGDCFQLVADKYQIDNRIHFDTVLEKIIEDMKINVTDHVRTFEAENWKAEYQEFTKEAIGYWKLFKISIEVLQRYKVKQLTKLTYNKKNKFNYKENDLMAFEFDVSGRKKLYVPTQGDHEKYFCKTQKKSDIFGLKQLPIYKLNYLVICEGEKDVLTCVAQGIPAVCFQSASTMPTKTQIRNLYHHASYLIVIYDNDKPGQSGAKRISEKYGLINYQLDTDSNDIADYLPNANPKDFKELLSSSIKDYRSDNNITLWEHNLRYWTYNSRAKKTEEVSNFVIEVDAMILSEDKTYRLIRLISRDYVTPTLSVDATVFNTEGRFVEFCESQRGNFLFFGTKSDLQEIKKRVFHLSEYLDEIDFSGYDKKRNIYVFSNGIIRESKFIKPDDFRIIDDLYLPEDSDQNKFKYQDHSKITITDYYNILSESFDDSAAITGIAYIIASLYFDHISSELRFFPILNVSGQKGSGKGSFVKMLMSLFSDHYEETSLFNATKNAVIRKLEQSPNFPVWFDEYKNSLSEDKIEALKNIYDLIGRSTAMYSNDNKTKRGKVLSSTIITGQEAPHGNEALYSRCVCLAFKTRESNKEKDKLFQKNLLELSKGLGDIFIELISHRETIIEKFQDVFYELQDYYSDALLAFDISVNTRLVKNYATIFTPLVIILRKPGTPLSGNIFVTEEKIKTTSYKLLEHQSTQESKIDEVTVFLEFFLVMCDKEIIKEMYDYNIENNILYFKSAALNEYQKEYIRLYGKVGPDYKTVRNYLTQKSYFHKATKAYFIDKGAVKRQRRCLSINLSVAPEFFREYFISGEVTRTDLM